MPFIEQPPLKQPHDEPRPKLSPEERWAAQLESTPRQEFFGRVGKIIDRALSIKTRYFAIAALAIAGGTVVYTEHVATQNPAPMRFEHSFDQPDPCVANLPKGLATEDPTLAMAKIQECHDNGALGGILQTSTTVFEPKLIGPQN